MTNLTIAHAFAHAKEGFKLVNAKFFIGDDRNTTQDAFNKAAIDSVMHTKLNAPIAVEAIDGHLQINNISDII